MRRLVPALLGLCLVSCPVVAQENDDSTALQDTTTSGSAAA